jgi:hypothetical protein
MLKAAIKLTLLIALGITGYAQKSVEPDHNLKPRNNWGVSIIPSMTTKTEIDGDKNKYNLHSHPGFGLEGLFQYHYNFRENYSLIFGIGLNIFESDFDYYIPKNMFDPPTDSDISSDRYLSSGVQTGSGKVQAELLRRWPHSKVHNWNMTAGLSLLFTFEAGGLTTWHQLDYPNGQTIQYLTFYHSYNNNGNPWFNFHISGGHEWVLRSKNIWQLNVKLNYSPINPSTGTYIFTTGVQPDLSGTLRTSGSYIGLSIAYLFPSLL